MDATSSYSQKRRSGRIGIELPIQISGTDVTGKDFNEPAQTLTLSLYGARVHLERPLVEDQEVTVYNPGNQKESDARVVGVYSTPPAKYTYGIEFMGQASNYWGIQFPHGDPV